MRKQFPKNHFIAMTDGLPHCSLSVTYSFSTIFLNHNMSQAA